MGVERNLENKIFSFPNGVKASWSREYTILAHVITYTKEEA